MDTQLTANGRLRYAGVAVLALASGVLTAPTAAALVLVVALLGALFAAGLDGSLSTDRVATGAFAGAFLAVAGLAVLATVAAVIV